MQDVKKNQKDRQLQLLKSLLIYLLFQTHTSLSPSLMQYETVPELHAVKENLI